MAASGRCPRWACGARDRAAAPWPAALVRLRGGCARPSTPWACGAVWRVLRRALPPLHAGSRAFRSISCGLGVWPNVGPRPFCESCGATVGLSSPSVWPSLLSFPNL